MKTYTTLRGDQLDLTLLTPRESAVFFDLLFHAGGITLLHLDECVDQKFVVNIDGFLDPKVFRAAAGATMRRAFKDEELERAYHGLLTALTDDIEDRLAVLHGYVSLTDIRHNPARFLQRIYDNVGSLREFSDKTGIPYTDSTPLLLGTKESMRLGVDVLRGVAKRTGYAFTAKPMAQQDTVNATTIRDRAHQELGQRMQAFTTLLHEEPHIPMLKAILNLEYTASGCIDTISFDTALLRARTHVKQYKLKSDGSLTVLVLDPKNVRDIANLCWLFLAQELHWFDALGCQIAFIIPRDIPSNIAEKQERIITGLDTTSEPRWSWGRIWEHLIFRPLYDPFDLEPKDRRADQSSCLNTIFIHLRSRARTVILEKMIAELLAEDIITRWCHALGWKIPTRQALLDATQEMHLQTFQLPQV